MQLANLAPFLNISAAGLLAAVVWYLLRQISSGQWVPKRELDYVRADRDARLAEKEDQILREHAAQAEWRAAHETSEAARELLAEDVRNLAGAVDKVNVFYDDFRAAYQRWELSDPDPPAGR
jgi:hypothetical protein